jgi:hypothetical protein
VGIAIGIPTLDAGYEHSGMTFRFRMPRAFPPVTPACF